MSKVHKSKRSSKDELKNPDSLPGLKKSKKKHSSVKSEKSHNLDDDVSYENNNDIKVEKEAEHLENIAASNEEKPKGEWNSGQQDTIDWPEKDLAELFRRIEMSIPEKDSLVYSTRVEKLNWEEMAFNDYSGEQCKKTWLLVQKRLRKYRLLSEVLTDAKLWISKPWTSFYRGKNKRHPDMPRKPLSSYMLFYMKKKDKVQAENPNLEMPEISKKIAAMYKNLPQSKKEKYDRLTAEKRKEYEEKLEEFHRLHPEIPKPADKVNTNKPATTNTRLKKKLSTPFDLYYKAQLEKEGETDKSSFREKCKAQWKAMSDKRKVVWIDWALEEEAKYNEEVKNLSQETPDYVPSTSKSKPVLTKEEKLLKERVAGKPTKPPMSAYSLFSRLLLQSEEIKKIPAKERMHYIALQWKDLSEDDKRVYKDQVNHLLEQYKLDYASYLESLPEEKRDEELQNSVPKRKRKKVDTKSVPKKKKAKFDIFKNEPAKPPRTSFMLFAKNYNGKKQASEVWKSMSKAEHDKYENELNALKKAYLVEFKKFLESLNKKQLKEFAEMRKNRKSSDNEEDESEDEEEEENDEHESDNSECSSDESS